MNYFPQVSVYSRPEVVLTPLSLSLSLSLPDLLNRVMPIINIPLMKREILHIERVQQTILIIMWVSVIFFISTLSFIKYGTQ